MAAVPKIDDAARGKPSAKVIPSARPDGELSVRNFIQTGLAFELIIAAVILVVSALGRITADIIPVGLVVFVMISFGIWGALALVAVPTFLVQRVRRTWTRRRAKHLDRTWDDWIDGPRPG
jgi:hypothetical protein